MPRSLLLLISMVDWLGLVEVYSCIEELLCLAV